VVLAEAFDAVVPDRVECDVSGGDFEPYLAMNGFKLLKLACVQNPIHAPGRRCMVQAVFCWYFV
jgi:hypothetical protein